MFLMDKLLVLASGLFAVVAGAILAHFYLPIPISEARGEWQIKDWYSHTDATPAQLQYYRDVRAQYPRSISIEWFWKGSIDSESCSWSQSLSRMLETRNLPMVWVTTLTCEDREPIRLVVRPHTKAIAPVGFFNFYARANDTEIAALFRNDDRETLIEYIPADWPRDE